MLKPIIPVGISFGGKKLRYGVLIDSGADFCIFDGEVGEQLGINVRSGTREVFGGIQERNGAEAFLHEVVLNVGGWDYKTKVGFSYDIAKHGFGIVGQKGFFNIFVVKFDLLREEVELKERK
ncbi:MAG: hypothetical protein V1656_01260 [Candidatus Jorgensenbacteria bacterium]